MPVRTANHHRPARNRPDQEAPLLILLAAVLLGIFLSMPGAQGSAWQNPASRVEQDLLKGAKPAHAAVQQSWTDPLILPSRDAAVRQSPLRKPPESAPASEPSVAPVDLPPVQPWPAFAAEPAGSSAPAVKMAGGIRTTGPPTGMPRPA